MDMNMNTNYTTCLNKLPSGSFFNSVATRNFYLDMIADCRTRDQASDRLIKYLLFSARSILEEYQGIILGDDYIYALLCGFTASYQLEEAKEFVTAVPFISVRENTHEECSLFVSIDCYDVVRFSSKNFGTALDVELQDELDG